MVFPILVIHSVNQLHYLGKTLEDKGQWYRSKEKLESFYPYGGYYSSKKWHHFEVNIYLFSKINSNNVLRMGKYLRNSVYKKQKFKKIHPAKVGWH